MKSHWLLISSVPPPLLPPAWPATSTSASHRDPALLLSLLHLEAIGRKVGRLKSREYIQKLLTSAPVKVFGLYRNNINLIRFFLEFFVFVFSFLLGSLGTAEL